MLKKLGNKNKHFRRSSTLRFFLDDPKGNLSIRGLDFVAVNFSWASYITTWDIYIAIAALNFNIQIALLTGLN